MGGELVELAASLCRDAQMSSARHREGGGGPTITGVRRWRAYRVRRFLWVACPASTRVVDQRVVRSLDALRGRP